MILTDPFDEQLRYPFPSENFDIVTESHQHFDHNAHRRVKGEFQLVNKAGTYNLTGLTIKGYKTYHDEVEGHKRGENIVFKFEFKTGISVLHLGDLGHLPSDELISEIGKVNVVMVPVGGTYTIDYRNAAEAVKIINADIIIPMHYKTDYLDFDIDGEESFINKLGYPVEYVKRLDINNSNLSDYSGKLILFRI